eukprot:CAMPEP_0113672882 /NCGR_PEP_ID=MMETSP0038_2-20120614/6531_1 /TAXON_ID=2898 /ORGANISM="Cryptomonas paramecium" /LENGTH=187 /DNA_ID=CAMNT_0000589243 /DNA_START=955 /DNA_END=1515 /DNA_ORIENTATION=+ /assembly_acc=CAM_ASM_000170
MGIKACAQCKARLDAVKRNVAEGEPESKGLSVATQTWVCVVPVTKAREPFWVKKAAAVLAAPAAPQGQGPVYLDDSEEIPHAFHGKRSISVRNLALLLDSLAQLPELADVDRARLGPGDLHDYLLAKHAHPALLFPELFSHEPPLAVLTYEWRLSFEDILSYLGPEPLAACARQHGADLPADPSLLT